VNTHTPSFDTTMGQMTEMSQRKKNSSQLSFTISLTMEYTTELSFCWLFSAYCGFTKHLIFKTSKSDQIFAICSSQGLQTTTRGPNPARKDAISMMQN